MYSILNCVRFLEKMAFKIGHVNKEASFDVLRAKTQFLVDEWSPPLNYYHWQLLLIGSIKMDCK